VVRKARYGAECRFRCPTHNGFHIRTHCLPDCKSRGKLQEKGVRIPGTGSVFLYGDSLVGECSRWLWAQVQILFTISYFAKRKHCHLGLVGWIKQLGKSPYGESLYKNTFQRDRPWWIVSVWYSIRSVFLYGKNPVTTFDKVAFD
jgi:hypothetical protein